MNLGEKINKINELHDELNKVIENIDKFNNIKSELEKPNSNILLSLSGAKDDNTVINLPKLDSYSYKKEMTEAFELIGKALNSKRVYLALELEKLLSKE